MRAETTQAPIVLLTDFGLEGPYVGQMKGVLAERAPGRSVIDLTHFVSPQDVLEGSFLLDVSWRHFPAGSVFLAIVDPGVGTDRAAIAVGMNDRWFVGPDNGVLGGLFRTGVHASAVRLENPKYRLDRISATFHGRDLFAPAGAALAMGADLEDLGPPHDMLMLLPDRHPDVTPDAIHGRIVHIDRFGNLVSNVGRDVWEDWLADRSAHCVTVRLGPWSARGLRRTYGETGPGETLALFGSLGHLEIAVNGGSAARHLAVARGAAILVEVA